MNAPINAQILKNISGKPEFAVIPYAEYLRLTKPTAKRQSSKEPLIPHEVVEMIAIKDFSPAKAWRKHLGLTQGDVATALGVSQPAYAKQEAQEKLSSQAIKQVAKALGINESQLDL